MAKKNPVQMQIAVTLNPAAYEFLEKNSKDGDLSGTLAGWCGYFVERQSRGGIFLEPEDHDYVAGLNGGKRLKDSRSLVRVIEKSLRRDEGQFAFVVKIDPAHIPVLQEHARDTGLTVEEAIEGIVQMIFSNGWVYEFTPNQGRNIPFTFAMLQSVKELCDKKQVNSTDIAGLIAEGRFMPFTREMQTQAKRISGGMEFGPAEFKAMMDRMEKLEAENCELKGQPREVAA